MPLGPNDEGRDDWSDMVLVGRVARSHGRRGQVIVDPETDFPERRFRPGAVLFMRREGRVRALTVTESRFHRGRPIVALEGISSIDAADALAGCELRIPAEGLEPLAEGSFYRHDLTGCRVVTCEGIAVGTVTAVEGPPGTSRLVVLREGYETLIPLAADICVRIDPAAREILIDPPEGLLELNAPGTGHKG